MYKVVSSYLYPTSRSRSRSYSSSLSIIDEGPQRELVIFMVKISILCTISLIFWLLRDGMWGYIFFKNHRENAWFLIVRMEETMAAVIDAICLYLSFNFAARLYAILCCPCHRLLYKCCLNYTFSDSNYHINYVQDDNEQESNINNKHRKIHKSSLDDPNYQRLEL